MPGTIIIRGISSTQNSLEGLPELWTEDCVDDGVQCRVEVSQPEKKTKCKKYLVLVLLKFDFST